VGGSDYFYPYKYKRRINTPVDEYTIVLRLAEQYLIRSEACHKQGKFQEALGDINIIRERAGLLPLELTAEDELYKAIFQERKLELFTEFGHRWFDLKRTGLVHAVLSPIKGDNWQETDQLFPIPFAEIQLNPELTQNPGY
jgi:hypothetical protein